MATTLRVGSRGSDLALWQTRWVVDRLCERRPAVSIEEIIIQTHGDAAVEQRFDADWPVGGFVGAIERELVAGRIDLAVHSYKDLPTAATPGLVISAVPEREVVHDVLVTREAVDLNHLPDGFRLGTSSPRRSAQFRRMADVTIMPIRGNVATRLAKIEREKLDGVVLAGAGLKRLDLNPPHVIALPVDRFVPSPAQGALAVQAREGSGADKMLRDLDDRDARRAVDAERSFLQTIGAGCHVPVGAFAHIKGEVITLHGQLFSDDGNRCVEGRESGTDPTAVGQRLAKRLLADLNRPLTL